MQVLELSFCQNETNWRQFWIFTALLSDGLLQGPRFGLLGNNVQSQTPVLTDGGLLAVEYPSPSH